MNSKNKICNICRDVDINGIILNGKAICKRCEKNIVNINTENNIYDMYVDKIKNILFKINYRGNM